MAYSDDELKEIIGRIKAGLSYLVDSGQPMKVEAVSAIVERCVRDQDITLGACAHEPDHRFPLFNQMNSLICADPAIEQWRSDDPDTPWLGTGQFVCRKCSSIYVGMYDSSHASNMDPHFNDIHEIIPSHLWAAPVPVSCPECAGTGKTEPRVVEYLKPKPDGTTEYATDTCEKCCGQKRRDPRALAEEGGVIPQ